MQVHQWLTHARVAQRYVCTLAGDYQFEEAVLNDTMCEVRTFDCTYDGRSIHPTRHHYHKWCLGSGQGNTRTWANITQALGHKHVQVLKMDIGEVL